MSAERFRPGDTIELPFLIVADGSIVNISDGIVSARLEGRRVSSELTVGAGLAIENLAPAPAAGSAEQEPHGVVKLDSTLTAQLPLGRLTKLTILYVNSSGVRMHAEPIWLSGEA